RAAQAAAAAETAGDTVMLVEIPQVQWICDAGHLRPVLVAHDIPELGGQTRQADRARIPPKSRSDADAIGGGLFRGRQLRAALLECTLPIRGDELLHFFDEPRQR